MSAAPTRKVGAGAVGGALAAVAFGMIAIFFPEQYALVPPGMEAGAATLFGALAGYFTPDGPTQPSK